MNTPVQHRTAQPQAPEVRAIATRKTVCMNGSRLEMLWVGTKWRIVRVTPAPRPRGG